MLVLSRRIGETVRIELPGQTLLVTLTSIDHDAVRLRIKLGEDIVWKCDVLLDGSAQIDIGELHLSIMLIAIRPQHARLGFRAPSDVPINRVEEDTLTAA